MNKKKSDIPSTSTDIQKLTDIFQDDSKKEQIDMLIESNLPETKKAILDIQHDIWIFMDKLRDIDKAKAGRAMLKNNELDDITQKYAISKTTKRELIKQILPILKLITEKHRKYAGNNIIEKMLDLGENISEKKAIIALISNEIRKYLYQKKYIQADLMNKMLNAWLGITKYGPDENDVSHIRNDKSLFDMQTQAQTGKNTFIKQQRFAHAEKLFQQQQYDQAEKLFKRLIQPKHRMRSDIPPTWLLASLKNTMSKQQQCSLPRKMREDWKAIQIPAHYLEPYFNDVLSLDRAVLSSEFSIFHQSEKTKQNNPYKEHLWLAWLTIAIENLSITRIIDDKKGNIHLILRDAYKRNDDLDHTTITKIYWYLKQIHDIKQTQAL